MPTTLTIKGNAIRERVSELLIKGNKPSLIDSIVSKESNISNRQVQRYCHEVKSNWLKQSQKNKQYNLSEAEAIKKDLFLQGETATEKNNIHNDLCKLQGLYVDKVIHETTVPLAIQINVGTDNTTQQPIIELKKD